MRKSQRRPPGLEIRGRFGYSRENVNKCRDKPKQFTAKCRGTKAIQNRIAEAMKGERARFIQIDPHALASAALGRSQKEVTKLFHEVIPEYAADHLCIALLDEVETLAPDRHRMSMEANPIDVHRATDAPLAGIDLLTLNHRNVLLIATTNFPEAVDRAFMSRADWIEIIPSEVSTS